jgi:hypothetical protein
VMFAENNDQRRSDFVVVLQDDWSGFSHGGRTFHKWQGSPVSQMSKSVECAAIVAYDA